MLEVIDKGHASEMHSYPLLFLHGAWHGAWCWDEHFLDFFATQGFRVLAPSLRGHGSSPIGKSIRMCSIADFVSDLSSVIDSLPSPPILVGHSLGGFVIQKYLETHDVPAAVLLASAPPRGQLSALMRSIRRHPWRSTKFTLTGKPSDLYGSRSGARSLLFSENAHDELVDAVAIRLQSSGTRAIMFDAVVGDLVDTQKVRTPMLVIGGEQDQMYTANDVRRTAEAYDTEPVFIPNMGHELMLEPDWRVAAGHIKSWLKSRGL
jgi:pimeloyl-ACP methyl ester carboxylesterase